jgi:glutamate-1-semialdehyde 2,1-aminomutase
MGAFHPSSRSPVAWGGTFSANPVSLAAAMAALTAYDQEAIAGLNGRGDDLRHQISHAGVRVNGSGSLMRIMEPVDAGELWWELYRRGVLTGTNALMSLSTAMNRDDIRLAGATAVDALTAVRARADRDVVPQSPDTGKAHRS